MTFTLDLLDFETSTFPQLSKRFQEPPRCLTLATETCLSPLAACSGMRLLRPLW